MLINCAAYESGRKLAEIPIEEIRSYIGVDTLHYLSLDGLIASTGVAGQGFCHACFSGEYPVEVPVGLGKAVLESPDRAPAGALEQLAHTPEGA